MSKVVNRTLRVAKILLGTGIAAVLLACSMESSTGVVEQTESSKAPVQLVSGGGPPGSARGAGQSLVAEFGVRSRSTLVGGRLEPRSRISHAPPFSGYVREIYVQTGDRVDVGTELYLMERDEIGRGFRPVVVSARIDGRVSVVDLEVEQLVSQNSTGVTVLNDSEYHLDARISDKDAFHVEVGRIVQAEAANGRRVEGKLVQRSQEPDYESGLFTLRFRFPAGESLSIGSFLLIELPTEQLSGFFVPRAAVERRLGRHFLWVIDEGTEELQLREVQVGESVGNETQVLDGIERGELFLARLTGREREGAPAGSRGATREG